MRIEDYMKKIILTVIAPLFLSVHAAQLKNLCSTLDIAVNKNSRWIAQLNSYASECDREVTMHTSKKHLPLCAAYPMLESLPYVKLCALPTPVHKLDALGNHIGVPQLWIKRDDMSGILYGGNKPRKLEFELGKAVAQGVDTVITFGCAGSNRAIRCSEYALLLGLTP